jgi:hypothetical protein
MIGQGYWAGRRCWACNGSQDDAMTLWETAEGLVCDRCVCAALDHIARFARAHATKVVGMPSRGRVRKIEKAA